MRPPTAIRILPLSQGLHTVRPLLSGLWLYAVRERQGGGCQVHVGSGFKGEEPLAGFAGRLVKSGLAGDS